MWDAALEQEAKDSVRSVTRGLGPDQQTEVLDLDRIVETFCDFVPLIPSGPIGMHNLFQFACFFIRREIEASLHLVRNTFVDHSAKTVKVYLHQHRKPTPLRWGARGNGVVCV